MSARNTPKAKEQRRLARTSMAEELTSRNVMHGICRGACGRRRLIWLPAMICGRCLMVAALMQGVSRG